MNITLKNSALPVCAYNVWWKQTWRQIFTNWEHYFISVLVTNWLNGKLF